jgi:hypothetical protein
MGGLQDIVLQRDGEVMRADQGRLDELRRRLFDEARNELGAIAYALCRDPRFGPR